MNLESVKLELENQGVIIVGSDSEYYWDDESIVFEYGETPEHIYGKGHILVYVYEDGLKYYMLTLEEDEEFGEMMFSTMEWGNCDTTEEMMIDLGIN